MNEKNGGRLAWIDMSRGIAIICIVISHSMLYSLRSQMLYSVIFEFTAHFELPLLFFISGWLFEMKRSTREIKKSVEIKNKFLRLMVPYFSFSIIIYLIYFAALKIPFLSPLIDSGGTEYQSFSFGSAVFQIVTYQDSFARHLWFLYALFVFYVLNILFPKVMKHPAALIVMLCLIFVRRTFMNDLPAIISYIMQYAFYFSLGRAMLKRKDRLFGIKNLTCAVIFVLFLALGIFTFILHYYGVFDEMPMAFLLVALKIIFALLGICSICVGCDRLSRTRLNNCLCFFGTRSMEVYLIHFPFITQGVTALMIKLLPAVPVIFSCAAGVLFGLAIPIAISELIIKRVPILSTVLLGAPLKRNNKTAVMK